MMNHIYELHSKSKIKNQNKDIKLDVSVLFTRKNLRISGKVIALRENSVLVEISPQIAAELEYATALTVVNYKNLTVLKSKKSS